MSPQPFDETALRERIAQIPCVSHFGVTLTHFESGICHATFPRNPASDGIFESFHGGMLMTAADTIACFALMTLTGPEQMMATTDMNIRFLTACLTDVTVHARVIKAGKTLCPVHVDLFDMHGKLVAIAQVTYLLLPKLVGRAS